MDLKQKNVVYIGGCGGIGSATCKQLLQKNVSNLAILDLTEDVQSIEELKSFMKNVFFIRVDVRSKASIQQSLNEVISKIGHIDILVNGVGLFNEFNPEVTVGVNLLGVIHGTMEGMTLMDQSKGNKGGLIVNIASVLGLDPVALSPVYCASKAGVIMYTRSMAKQAAIEQTGVSLVTICPGMTTTPLLKQFTSEEFTRHSEPIANVFLELTKQTPDALACCIVDAMELNKNAAVYICDGGELKEVSIPAFWAFDKVQGE